MCYSDLFVIVNNVTVNIVGYMFLWLTYFISFGYFPMRLPDYKEVIHSYQYCESFSLLHTLICTCYDLSLLIGDLCWNACSHISWWFRFAILLRLVMLVIFLHCWPFMDFFLRNVYLGVFLPLFVICGVLTLEFFEIIFSSAIIFFIFILKFGTN